MEGNTGMEKPELQKGNGGQNFLDFVLEPFRNWYGYIRENFREYYIGLLRINLTALAVTLLSYLVIFLVMLGVVLVMVGVDAIANPGAALIKLVGNLALLAVALLVVLILLAIAGWLSKSISLTSVLYTNAQFEKTPFSLREAFDRIKWPVLRFVILELAITFAILAPAFVVMFVLYGATLAALLGSITSGTAGAILGIFALIFAMLAGIVLSVIYILIVSLIYDFLAQFWAYGFLLGGLGVVDALKRSVGICRRHFAKVAVFYIIFGIAVLVASIPLIIYGLFANLTLDFVRSLAERGAGLTLWAVYIIALLIDLVITLFLSTVVQLFRLPTHYLFWKKVNAG